MTRSPDRFKIALAQSNPTVGDIAGNVAKEGKHGSVEWAVAWVASDDGFSRSYCNTIPTHDGGTHEAGLRQALYKGLRAYGELTGNKKAAQVVAEDVMGTAAAMLSVFIREPEFQGQTKDKLATQEATRIVETAVRDAFDHWLADSPQQATRLLEWTIEQAEDRLKRRREKEIDLNRSVRSGITGDGEFVYLGVDYGSQGRLSRVSLTAPYVPVRWELMTRGAVSSAPAVFQNVIYVASEDGNVYAVEAATGALRWTFATKGERRFTAPGIHGAIPRTERMPDPFDVFLSSPAVAAGTVYIGSGDQHVYALDAATGTLRWSFATGDVVHASPAVVDDVVYIGSWDRNLYALAAATGRELWRYTTGNDTTIYNQIGIASSATVADGIVFVGGRDGHFHAVDARTGTLRWKHDNKMGWTIASPAVQDGVVYFPTSDGRRFKALDAASGAILIDLQNAAVSFSSPSIAGEVAYYGTSDGYLNAVGIKDGKLRARFQTDGSKENGSRYTGEDGVLRTGTMYPDRTLDGLGAVGDLRSRGG